MAEKDIAEKDLEAMNDVFADIMNNLMFGGVEYVKEDDLEQGRERSSYSSETQPIREQVRDVSKFWKQNQIRLAHVGLENQTEPEDDMPFRNIGYDGAAYRDQISYVTDAEGKRHKVLERYPVVTLTLYMGYEKRWDKAKSLYEALGDKLDDRLKPFVHDYPLNLFEIAFITDEQLAKFKSDFWFVADYLVQMRKDNRYVPSDRQMRHVREVLNIMAALTGDERFRVNANEIEEGDEPLTMNDFFSKAIKKSEEEGRREGEKKAADLINYLWLNGRGEDAMKASEDQDYFDALLSDYQNGELAVS